MLFGVFKKFAVIMLVVVVYQNWGKIENFVSPSSAVTAQVSRGPQSVRGTWLTRDPLIDANGTLIRGFSEDAILAALK